MFDFSQRQIPICGDAGLVKHILLRRTSLASQPCGLRASGFTRFEVAWSYTQLGTSVKQVLNIYLEEGEMLDKSIISPSACAE